MLLDRDAHQVTSLVSSAVVAGFQDSDGKFKTFIELRNEIVCPPNPYK